MTVCVCGCLNRVLLPLQFMSLSTVLLSFAALVNYIEMKIHPFSSRSIRFLFNLALGLGWWMCLEAHNPFTCGECTPPRV